MAATNGASRAGDCRNCPEHRGDCAHAGKASNQSSLLHLKSSYDRSIATAAGPADNTEQLPCRRQTLLFNQSLAAQVLLNPVPPDSPSVRSVDVTCITEYQACPAMGARHDISPHLPYTDRSAGSNVASHHQN